VEEGGIIVEEGGIMFGGFIMFGLFIDGGIEPPQEPPLQDMAESPFMPIGGAELPIMLPPQEGPEHCAGGGGGCIEGGEDADDGLHGHG